MTDYPSQYHRNHRHPPGAVAKPRKISRRNTFDFTNIRDMPGSHVTSHSPSSGGSRKLRPQED
eukprot:CAMPEP_0113949448 /NCGR_PEP_ID=MMETSP1339-20121228/75793_1 /TAXON_ID=94617 /ORGANISM="Fibrocapsa japonica" /LENGTH=62 /DNA_ID=CAMNT_0000956897 /DNA_START=65 /DNA_END=250 /DNA_ORIENTATION=- /assembly_acc=CAM_ASM_000762